VMTAGTQLNIQKPNGRPSTKAHSAQAIAI
jgi:hypothetical protein